MSASLVGSEMCIRDSGRLQWFSNSGAKPGFWCAKSQGLRGLRIGGLWIGCLLYTSDAADDM
eukprot:9838698-Alexandrium_andersonii.AAC.1